MKKYSVLMSVYIKEKPEYLKQSIDSMINQTICPDEIVIVKDGPLTSELEMALQEYVNKYPNLFNIITSEKNIGLGLALDLGLKHCRNKLVARMDTDDISLPERCERQLEIFEQDNNIALVGGNILEFIDTQENIISRRIVPQENAEIIKYLRKRCPFNHMTVMFKKDEVLTAGSYKDWFCNEDYYLWIRMYQNKAVFRNMEENLVYVRVGEEMYQRRGGLKYFISEAKIQKYMYDMNIIGGRRYIMNIIIRFTLQVLMTKEIRGFVFKKFAREKL